MTLGQLEIFVCFLREGSVTSAALKLGITPSAVSHSLASLEKDLGVALLDRDKGSGKITKIGERVAELAREIMGLSETIIQEADAAKGQVQGVLRIGSFGASASLKLLPPIIEKFRASYPHVMLKVNEASDDEIVAALVERRIDIGCVVLPDDRFDTLLLAEDRLVVALPSNHWLASKESISLAELSQEILLMTDAGSAPLIEAAYKRAGVQMRIGHRFSQVLSMLGWVAKGEGIVLIAELAVPDYFPDIVIRPLVPACYRPIGLAVRDFYESSELVRAFWLIAEKYFKKRYDAR